MGLPEWLKEKKPQDLDAPETTLAHRDLILNKPFLRKLYVSWYDSYLKQLPKDINGQDLEIGAGGGFLKDLYPEVITSDIIELPNCDLTCSATDLPFDDHSLRSIFMLDVLHHIPNVRAFFSEASRTLKKGGAIFMIEPTNTFFSSLIFKNFHHEPFDPSVRKWEFETSGPLSDSNQALPWVIFKRDILEFQKEYPELKLEDFKIHTPFRYLLTGGLSYKSVVPGWSFPLISFFEKLFTPLYPFLAMFQTTVIRKI